MQSPERNPALKLITRDGTIVLPASAIAALVVGTDPIPIPTGYRMHLWAISVYMYPFVAGDSDKVDLIGGNLLAADLYGSEDPGTYIASFFLAFPPPPMPKRLYISGIGDAFGQAQAGDAPLLEIPAQLSVMGDARGTIGAVALSSSLTFKNSDAVNAHTIFATVSALYSIEQ